MARGMVPSSKMINFEILEPESDISAALQLAQGDEVYFVERIRFADDKPMAIERTYLPVKQFPDLHQDSFKGSLYAMIEKDQQLTISRATQRMEAGLVKKEDADLLQIKPPAAILMIERISYLAGEMPFEVVRSTYRADRYKFTTDIQR